VAARGQTTPPVCLPSQKLATGWGDLIWYPALRLGGILTRYVVRRLIALLPTLVGVTIVIFLFLRLIPGDPAVSMLGEHAATENVERIREQLGLNRPLFLDQEALEEGDIAGFFDSQYIRYVGRLLRGDLGDSIHRRIPVADTLKARFPATAELALSSMLIGTIIGVLAGIISSARRNSPIDTTTMLGSLAGVSVPVYWLGLMVIMLFAVMLQWLPAGGRLDPALELETPTNFYLIDAIITGNTEALVDVLKHLALPALVLATHPMSIIARMTRSSMLEVLQEDYIRTAQAKGLRESAVLLRHALKNAFLPVITIIGLSTGSLLAGAILTETIFSWPGIGKWVYDAILARDYPIVQGGTLLIALIFVLANLVVDVSYAFLDPRIHYE
jgi:ABC-type dipeptide/oligopeptide/nickel transport system permease component